MAWSVQGNIKGLKGDTGPIGPQGPPGATGPQGATGTSATNYQGAYNNTANYAKGDLVSENGGAFIAPTAITAGNDPNTSGDGRTATNGWSTFAAEGAQGAAGVKGDTGATGAQGTKGDTGATGSQGSQGVQGPQGTAGATGPAGAQGTQGVRGSKIYTGTGAPGTYGDQQAGDIYIDTATSDIYNLS